MQTSLIVAMAVAATKGSEAMVTVQDRRLVTHELGAMRKLVATTASIAGRSSSPGLVLHTVVAVDQRNTWNLLIHPVQ